MADDIRALDARRCHRGTYSSWLTKTSTSRFIRVSKRRHFTIDFDRQTLSYTRGQRDEGDSARTLVTFSDIQQVDVVGLPPAPASTRQRISFLMPSGRANGCRFDLATRGKTMTLEAASAEDAALWVSALEEACLRGRFQRSHSACEEGTADAEPEEPLPPSSRRSWLPWSKAELQSLHVPTGLEAAAEDPLHAAAAAERSQDDLSFPSGGSEGTDHGEGVRGHGTERAVEPAHVNVTNDGWSYEVILPRKPWNELPHLCDHTASDDSDVLDVLLMSLQDAPHKMERRGGTKDTCSTRMSTIYSLGTTCSDGTGSADLGSIRCELVDTVSFKMQSLERAAATEGENVFMRRNFNELRHLSEEAAGSDAEVLDVLLQSLHAESLQAWG